MQQALWGVQKCNRSRRGLLDACPKTTPELLELHQVFLAKVFHILFQFGRIENLDVVGESHIEPSDSFQLIDFGVEIPNVVISFMGLDAVLCPGELLNQQVLCHQVQL